MPRPAPDPAIVQAARDLIASGASSRQAAARLAEDHGVTVDQATITRWARGIPRTRGRKPRDDVADEAVTAARDTGASYAQAAGQLGIAKSTAWRRANKPPPQEPPPGDT